MAYCTQSDLEARIGVKQLAELTSDNSNLYVFTVSGITVDPTAGAVYTNNGQSFTVISVSLTGVDPSRLGTLTASFIAGVPTSSGTLTKSTGTGDATIAFSAATASDTAVIAKMIQTADDIINAKAGQVYTVPFIAGTNCTAIPSLIKQISISLSIYYCLLRRFTSTDVPKFWAAEKEAVMQSLDDISNQEAQLDGSPTVISQESSFTSNAVQMDFYNSQSKYSLY